MTCLHTGQLKLQDAYIPDSGLGAKPRELSAPVFHVLSQWRRAQQVWGVMH